MNYPSGLYTSQLVLHSGGLLQEIPIALEVKPKSSLFDVQATVLPDYKFVKGGDPFYTQINLFNFKGSGRFDVDLEEGLRSSTNTNIIVLKRETVAVETQTNIIRNYILPYDLPPGDYFFYTKISYLGAVQSVSSDRFTLIAAAPTADSVFLQNGLYLFLSLFALLFLYHLYLLALPRQRAFVPSRFPQTRPSPSPVQSRSIQNKLALLEESYRSGLITKKSYLRDKQALVEVLRKRP